MKQTRSYTDYPWDDIDFFSSYFVTFTIICHVFHIFAQFTLIFNHDNYNPFNKLMLKTLLGPPSHIVEANEEWRVKCCRAGRGLGTDCRCSRSDWGRAGRCLCPVLLSPPGLSSDTLSWVPAGKVGLLHFSEEFEILLQLQWSSTSAKQQGSYFTFTKNGIVCSKYDLWSYTLFQYHL